VLNRRDGGGVSAEQAGDGGAELYRRVGTGRWRCDLCAAPSISGTVGMVSGDSPSLAQPYSC